MKTERVHKPFQQQDQIVTTHEDYALIIIGNPNAETLERMIMSHAKHERLSLNIQNSRT